MNNPFTGGCVCGAVRYECAAEPMFMGNCHCRDCQKATGAAYVPTMAVPATALKISGDVNYYEVKTEGGNTVRRGFCPTCGARLLGKTSGLPDVTVIFAGSLDDPSRYKPGMDVYTSSAQPWDYMNPELPKFPKLPQ